MNLCGNGLHDLDNPSNVADRSDGGIRCKPCRDSYNHRYYEQNRTKIRANTEDYRKRNSRLVLRQKRGYSLRVRYGISIADYEAISKKQEDRCAVCGEQETAHYNDGRVRRLAVDHDHKTGKIRGLLCDRCNRKVGMLVDDPNWLERAVEYVRQS